MATREPNGTDFRLGSSTIRTFSCANESNAGLILSALGQAAVNIAAHAQVNVIATTRNKERFSKLEKLEAQHVLLEGPEVSRCVRELHPNGLDTVLDLVGNGTVLNSLGMARRGGRVCEAGFLGGVGLIKDFNPLLQMPSGVHFSFFGSFMFGTKEFPLSDIPFLKIVDRAADGAYKAKPAKVFRFPEIQDAHRLMESSHANGKIVVVM